MTNHIFVSYSHKDWEFAELLETKLSDKAFDIWLDKRVSGGEDWKDEIDRAIRESFAVIVVMSNASMKSTYVTYEWSLALGLGLTLIPIKYEPEVKLHSKLDNLQHLDFSTRHRDWDGLKQTIIDEQKAFLGTGRAVERAILLMNEGRQQYNANNLHSALQTLRRAINLADNVLQDDLYYEIGRIQKQLGKVDEAEKSFKNAISISEEHVKSQIELGHIYRDKAKEASEKDRPRFLDQAAAYFTTALNLQPEILDSDGESVYASLGGIRNRQRLYPQAIEAYKKAASIKRTSYPYNNLGLLYMRLGEFEKMRDNFRLVKLFAEAKLSVNPGDEWVHNDLFTAQVVTDELDKAKLQFENVLLIGSERALESLQRTLEVLCDIPQMPDHVIKYIKNEVLPKIITRLDELEDLNE